MIRSYQSHDIKMTNRRRRKRNHTFTWRSLLLPRWDRGQR